MSSNSTLIFKGPSWRNCGATEGQENALAATIPTVKTGEHTSKPSGRGKTRRRRHHQARKTGRKSSPRSSSNP